MRSRNAALTCTNGKWFQFLIALVLLTAWQMLSVIKSDCTVDAADRVKKLKTCTEKQYLCQRRKGELRDIKCKIISVQNHKVYIFVFINS